MKQQINLYQDHLIDRNPPLQVSSILLLMVGCLGLLIAGTVYMSWQQRQLESEQKGLKAELAEFVASLEVVKVQNPPRLIDPQLKLVLHERQGELTGRKPLLSWLEHFNPDMVQGFSSVLDGLARHPLEGIWLTNIRIDSVKHQVLLAGSAVKSELIPAYLKHLGENKVLNDQSFARLKMTGVKERTRKIDFLLETDFGAADE